MRSISSTNKSANSSVSLALAGLAKNLLFARLAAIKVGHLTVEEGGETYTFGERRQTGALNARVIVHDASLYARVLSHGATGAGEAYMAGQWDSPDLVTVVRLIVANQSVLDNMDGGISRLSKQWSRIGEALRMNTRRGSKRNIAAHYDLSNAFFRLFLDETMMYSAAIFPTEESSLEEASLTKLEHICQQLRLQPEDHLLEIGTGWGGMAIYAAKYYGCRVTTTTISDEQYALACARVQAEKLADRVTVLKQDYRDLRGRFDKLVSIEMVEAVGHQYYRTFFRQCSTLLKPEGLMLMQAITTQDARYEREKNTSDFIRKYIFPGGCLPSNAVIAKHIAADTDMHTVAIDDITLDYARTLAAWRERFGAQLEQVRALGFDETFIRMWDFYLCYCEGGFRERVINTSQFVFAKPACRVLPKVLRA